MKGSGPLAWMAYVGIRVIFALMQVFPMGWNLRTARWLAWFWMLILPRHRERAVAHLRNAFGPELSERRTQEVARRCLESAAMFAVEAVCLPRLIGLSTWNRYIQLERFEEVLDLIVSGKGLILVTAHYGSFEVVGHFLACLGFDVAAVMRPIDNFYLNRFLVETRRKHGLALLDKRGAMQDAEALVSGGTLMAFIGDQDAGRKGLFVSFFGQPASTYKSIGLLAMSTKVPIVVGYARREGNLARYVVGAERIIHPHEWEKQDDPLVWITQTFSAALESMIRAAPEQYWWMHRRWKHQPKGNRHASPSKPDLVSESPR